MHFSTLFSATALTQVALAGYVLQDDYMSGNFYDNFEFFTAPDPTHGFVKYVDQGTAQSMNLLNASSGSGVGWGVDTVNKDQGGRASVRLTSKKVYNKGLVVIDVGHMPVGCGTWPAFWMVGPNWPNAGEIDIIEGVHEQESNSITLHTGAGCGVKNTGAFGGDVVTENCDVKAPGQDENAGCSIKQKGPNTYGNGLNSNGGGVFATEWTSDAISVWFFPRGDGTADALGANPDPSSWGQPAARFEKSGCDIDSFFKDQQIVFDTTFCGDWAGNTWGASCAAKTGVQTCNDFVRDNPDAFTNAFWSINALKVYSNDGSASSQSPSSGKSPKTPTVSEPGSEPVASDDPSGPAEPTPVFKSSDASGPVSSGFDSPPIVDPTDIPSGQPDAGVTAPVPSPTDVPSTPVTRTRTRHQGGPGGQGRQGGRPTQKVGSATLEAASPTAPVEAAGLGGFTWPAAKPRSEPSPTAELSSTETTCTSKTPKASSPTPSSSSTTCTSTVATGTQSLSSVDYKTVPTFSATIPVGVPIPTGEPVYPNVGATPAAKHPTPCTKHDGGPSETAPLKKARHARSHRRRMVQHNARK